MKLWLLEILACPIDKAFPLELDIFRWEGEGEENNEDQIQILLDGFASGNVLAAKMESPIQGRSVGDDHRYYLHDDLILKPTEATAYFAKLLTKIEELKHVHDHSGWAGTQALTTITDTIKDKLLRIQQQWTQIDITSAVEEDLEAQYTALLTPIIPALEFLNLFKYHLEILDGVMRCPKCQRWYPIFETIPQMLPDGVRDAESDQKFVDAWTSLYKF
jgi:uncharacterized protein YbaR (Trm112 family)